MKIDIYKNYKFETNLKFKIKLIFETYYAKNRVTVSSNVIKKKHKFTVNLSLLIHKCKYYSIFVGKSNSLK